MLAQAFDEKTLLLIHQRIIDGRSAKIHTGYDWHAISPPRLEVCSAQRSRIFLRLSQKMVSQEYFSKGWSDFFLKDAG
jgi:hypothetical protein